MANAFIIEPRRSYGVIIEAFGHLHTSQVDSEQDKKRIPLASEGP